MRGNQHKSRRAKAIGTGCAAALVATSMVVAGTPTAQAADAEEIVTAIAPDDSVYEGWHQGYADAAHSYGLTDGGLMMTGKSQVINGYTNNTEDLSDGDNVALRRTLRLASYELGSGQARFQVALYFDNTNDDTNNPTFTTLRPADPGTAGRNEIGTGDTWVTSRKINDDYLANGTGRLGALLKAIGAERKTIGFGVLTTPGTDAVVESIEWDDTTYKFKAPKVERDSVGDSDIDLDDEPYAGWHQGAVNDGVPGEHRVTAKGLELTDRSQVINGYEDNTEDVDLPNVHLPSAIENASYNVLEGSVHFQIPLFFEAPGQGGVGFTTLRPADPATEGKNDLSLDDEWISSRVIGSVPSNTPTPLRELIAPMTAYKVLGFGVFNDSGDATVKRITFDGVRYSFLDTAVAKKDQVVAKDIAPRENDNTYTQWHQGAKNGDEWGKHAVTNEGLELDGRSQVINGDPKANKVSLQHALRDATYNVASGEAWFQVALFIDTDGDDATDPEFTTLRPADGAGVDEHEISLQDQWVSSRGFDDVNANTPTPLADLVNAVGSDYTVLAFGVFSDTGGDATVKNIAWGGTTYRFVNRKPFAKKVTVKTKARKARTVRLPKVDRDGNTVTYEFDKPVNGKRSAEGRKVTYTPNRNFTGKDRIRYTVTDEYGKSDSGRIVVRVQKVNSRITKATVRPKRLTPRKPARVIVRVRSGGDAATGRVLVRERGKLLGGHRLKDGKATVRLGRLKRGKHTLMVRYTGSKIAKLDVKKVTVRVRRR